MIKEKLIESIKNYPTVKEVEEKNKKEKITNKNTLEETREHHIKLKIIFKNDCEINYYLLIEQTEDKEIIVKEKLKFIEESYGSYEFMKKNKEEIYDYYINEFIKEGKNSLKNLFIPGYKNKIRKQNISIDIDFFDYTFNDKKVDEYEIDRKFSDIYKLLESNQTSKQIEPQTLILLGEGSDYLVKKLDKLLIYDIKKIDSKTFYVSNKIRNGNYINFENYNFNSIIKKLNIFYKIKKG